MRFSVFGLIYFVFMDWCYFKEILGVGRGYYSEFKNICVWVKINGGMGIFYCFCYEFIFVFKNGDEFYINNFEFG